MIITAIGMLVVFGFLLLLVLLMRVLELATRRIRTTPAPGLSGRPEAIVAVARAAIAAREGDRR